MTGAMIYAKERFTNTKKNTSTLLLGGVGAYVLAAYICSHIIEVRPELLSLSNVLFLPACAMAVYAAAHGAGSGLLASIPLRFLGAISYSLYLWHLVFIRLVRMPQFVLPHLATRILWALFVAIVVSSLNFLLVERPFLKLRPHNTKVKAVTS